MRKTAPQQEKTIRLPRTLFVSVVNQGIKSFSDIVFSPAVKTIDVSGNPITNFEGLQDVNCLTTLRADRTQINSLQGGVTMKSLLKISLFESPIASAKLLSLMCVIVFGPSLAQVNGKTVTERTRRIAAEIRPKIRKYLLDGCLLVAVSPMTVLPLGAKEPIILDMEENDAEEQKRQIAENERKLAEMRKQLIQLQQQQKRQKKPDVLRSMISPPSKRGPRKQEQRIEEEPKVQEEASELPKTEEEEKHEEQPIEEQEVVAEEETPAVREEEEKGEQEQPQVEEEPKHEEEEQIQAEEEPKHEEEEQIQVEEEPKHEEEEQTQVEEEPKHEEEEQNEAEDDAPKQKYSVPTGGDDDDDIMMPGAGDEAEEVKADGEEDGEVIPKIPKIQNDFSDDIELPDVAGNEDQSGQVVSHSESIDQELNAIKNIEVPPGPDESGIVHGEHENTSCDLSEIGDAPERNPSSDNLLSGDLS